MTEYDRDQHEASCPCKLCIAHDVELAHQAGLPREVWKSGGLERLVALFRNRKLNWDFPAGHCLICGGSSMYAHAIQEHHIIQRFNITYSGGRHLCSLLLHKQGSMIGNVKLLRGNPARFKEWCSNLQDLLPEKCLGYNLRDIGDWLEIRLAYSEMVDDRIEQRIERRWQESRPRKGEDTRLSAGTP